MIQFPTTDKEFEELFKTAEDCLAYIIAVRWPDGPKCPKCQCDKLWRNDKGHILECSVCGHRMAAGRDYFPRHSPSFAELGNNGLAHHVAEMRFQRHWPSQSS
jgi:Zn ribbon nucleic-acid-binding protein